MSFRDWYHPDRNSPQGRSGPHAGAEFGAQIGALFGPAGAAVGAGIGAVIGTFSGSSGARKRAKRRATQASYSFAGELYQYSSESRAEAERQYERDLSMLTVRTAASGARTGETYERERGRIILDRDQTLADLDAEVQSFREGENYAWFRRDLAYQTTPVGTTIDRKGRDENKIVYRIGRRDQGRAGHRVFNPEQYSQLRRTDAVERTDNITLFREYAKRVSPTLEWYERKVFGNKEDAKAYDEYMDKRIADANKWYDAQVAVNRVRARQDRARFQYQGGDR